MRSSLLLREVEASAQRAGCKARLAYLACCCSTQPLLQNPTPSYCHTQRTLAGLPGRELWIGWEIVVLFHLCSGISGVCSWLSHQSANVSISKFLLACFLPQKGILNTQQPQHLHPSAAGYSNSLWAVWGGSCIWTPTEVQCSELETRSRTEVLPKNQMVDGRLSFCAPNAPGFGFHFFTPKTNGWTLMLKALEYKLFLIFLFTVRAWSVFSLMRRWSHWAQILVEVLICWLWLWTWLPWDVINHLCHLPDPSQSSVHSIWCGAILWWKLLLAKSHSSFRIYVSNYD